jgi:flagellar basal-body rod modification protein FlgD
MVWSAIRPRTEKEDTVAISAAGSVNAASSSAGNLTLEDFLKVLLTQLTYQDPLEPMDNQQFMAQIAQFTSLQQTQEMNANLARLLGNQSALQSVGLIGRTVSVITEYGPRVGQVTALSLTGNSPSLTIQLSGGVTLSNIDLSSVTGVR